MRSLELRTFDQRRQSARQDRPFCCGRTAFNTEVSHVHHSRHPKVGFVSLGCPKALVDSERILTQLRMEGYEVVPTYEDADVVVVNTCGFIDSAKAESLEVIGEAIKENGKVIVTGCMGVDEGNIRDVHPSVLSVTGPQQYEQVVNAVHEVVPPRQDHNPLIDLVPPQGVKLTPRHYAYLKISEGCNHSCSFCIIPSMRGKLVSRPVGEVLSEAERLVKAGVKEILVISQDTSAYGVDVKYKTDFWNGRPVKTRMLELCEALSSLGAWVRLHYVYPYPNVDDVIPLMAAGKILPYLDIPFQHASPKVLKSMKRPAFEDRTLARIKNWREQCPELVIRSTFIVGFLARRRKTSSTCWTGSPKPSSTASAASNTRQSKAPRPTTWAWKKCRMTSSRTAGTASWLTSRPSAPLACNCASARKSKC